MMTVQEFYPLFLKFPEISTDSRDVRENHLFFALRGATFDGNRFVGEALRRGAARAVADDPALKGLKGVIIVDDVLTFLQQLARYHRSLFSVPVVALTGSNGKTTTKELMAAVLRKKYNLLSTTGNLNNHIGVPLTILRLRAEHELAVIEMGANHIGEIAQLCGIAAPDHGLITNIGHAHLEGFGSFEGVIQAKTEMYRYLTSRQGTVFLCTDDELLTRELGAYPAAGYGMSEWKVVPEAGTRLSFTMLPPGHDQRLKVETHLVGAYNVQNVLAALAVGQYFGVDLAQAVEAVQAYQPGNHRSQWHRTPHNDLILDAYNANPSSMKLALEMFFRSPGSQKMAILGGMRELGAYSAEAHREILQMVSSAGIPVVLVGHEFAEVAKEFGMQAYPDVIALSQALSQSPPRGCTILLKGSRGIRLEQILPLL